MSSKPSPSLQQPYVTTMHILSTGEVLQGLKQYEKMEDRFSWVDKPELIKRIQSLRAITDRNKRSVIVLYEKGQIIKEFLNVDKDFQPTNAD